ncbi:hypothetical protein [Shewanella sp. OMA3-2]|uniref:hypothetical protein n=1 Tax=Shewanella sp. OMA3-2 TaxID=2908650 RepID=UPI001F3F2DFC|nr:hypothetical protein [Shewanella sp. OMA3-2]UJF22833.1 hypothetical protein L0B17_05460 [Shewanella sp. OMA3-2]
MRLFLLALVFLLGACVTHKAELTLYSTFVDYKSNTSGSNIIEVSPKFFSKQLLSGLNLDSSGVIDQLLFKNYMDSEVNHLEIIGDDFSCLTVNGYDTESMPISFNLKFIESNHRWLIDEINVLFINSEVEFSQVAKCPSAYNS